jgi:hypothetical protein
MASSTDVGENNGRTGGPVPMEAQARAGMRSQRIRSVDDFPIGGGSKVPASTTAETRKAFPKTGGHNIHDLYITLSQQT